MAVVAVVAVGCQVQGLHPPRPEVDKAVGISGTCFSAGS